VEDEYYVNDNYIIWALVAHAMKLTSWEADIRRVVV
jgi:hypothetical protein